MYTTEKKPVVDEQPLQYTHDGKALDLHDESQEPFTAAACKKRRDKKEAAAGGEKKPLPRYTKLDFIALVLARGLKTKEQVLAYAQVYGSAALQGSNPQIENIILHKNWIGSAREVRRAFRHSCAHNVEGGVRTGVWAGVWAGVWGGSGQESGQGSGRDLGGAWAKTWPKNRKNSPRNLKLREDPTQILEENGKHTHTHTGCPADQTFKLQL